MLGVKKAVRLPCRTLGLHRTLASLSIVLVSAAASGCAYPRKSTPLSAATDSRGSEPDSPDDLWRLVVVSAEIPREKRSGLAWDGADPPDPYVRLSVGDRELWKTETVEDQTHPRFDQSPPRNLALKRSERLRIELWDDDGMSSEPIGIYEGRALGEAILEADTILKLEGGATLTVRVEPPVPHRGLGIALYELRKDALRILEVMPRSPASRAGLVAGDRVIAIAGRTIDELGPKGAESALVMAAPNQSELMVQGKDGKTRTVKLDRGHVWLSL